ncbi:MAG: hypothetical protein M3Q80_02940 [bacterium]|nr:hypothetical protein [bacterium]
MNRNITALILIVLAIGIFMTFTRTKLTELQGMRKVNAKYAVALANAKTLLKARDEANKKWNAIEPQDRERLEKIIPDTIDNIRLIIDLNAIARQNGNLSLRNIKAVATDNADKQVAPPKTTNAAATKNSGITTPKLDVVTVSFSLNAPYEQFILFMEDLEKSLRILDVTHLTVAVAQNGTYDFGVELKTYWLRQ